MVCHLEVLRSAPEKLRSNYRYYFTLLRTVLGKQVREITVGRQTCKPRCSSQEYKLIPLTDMQLARVVPYPQRCSCQQRAHTELVTSAGDPTHPQSHGPDAKGTEKHHCRGSGIVMLAVVHSRAAWRRATRCGRSIKGAASPAGLGHADVGGGALEVGQGPPRQALATGHDGPLDPLLLLHGGHGALWRLGLGRPPSPSPHAWGGAGVVAEQALPVVDLLVVLLQELLLACQLCPELRVVLHDNLLRLLGGEHQPLLEKEALHLFRDIQESLDRLLHACLHFFRIPNVEVIRIGDRRQTCLKGVFEIVNDVI